MTDKRIEMMTTLLAAIPAGMGVSAAVIGQTILLTTISAAVSGVVGFFVGKWLTSMYEKQGAKASVNTEK